MPVLISAVKSKEKDIIDGKTMTSEIVMASSLLLL
jgi:hypothetical protein